MIELNCKVVKKSGNPLISTPNSPPPFQVYPSFLVKKFCTRPQATQFLEGPTPLSPFNKGGGEGGEEDSIMLTTILEMLHIRPCHTEDYLI